MKNQKTNTRRQFLKGLGGFTLALPFMPSLMSTAYAQSVKPPKRFLAFLTSYGHRISQFFPTVEANQKLSDHVWHRRLDDMSTNPISEIFHSGFNPYKSKINIIRGMDQTTGNGHNESVPLCASSGGSKPKYGKSIDVIMGQSSAIYSVEPRFRVARIAEGRSSHSLCFDRLKTNEVISIPAITGNSNFLDFLFAGISSVGGASVNANESAERKILITDKVLESFNMLTKNPRLSKSDQLRLHEHITSIADVQKRLRLTSVVSSTCTRPTLITKVNTDEIYKNYANMISAAFACDLTRVVVLSMRHFDSANSARSDHHNSSHSREGNNTSENLKALNYSKWQANQLLYIVEKLYNTIESDGSRMLDNTLIYWGSELSNGKAHRWESIPVATIGGAGGTLKTGYYLDMRQRPFIYTANRKDYPPKGHSITQFHITLMRAMGLNPSEYMPHGDGGGFGDAISSGLYTSVGGLRNDTLPLLFTG